MPVNPYDDRKVALRRPHGNGDLDIVRASYTRRKANVTKALLVAKMSTYIEYKVGTYEHSITLVDEMQRSTIIIIMEDSLMAY